MFTARNRQNPFAKRRREQAAAKAAEAAAAPEPVAVPFDRNAESEEYEQAPDIATYPTGGVVEASKPVIVAMSDAIETLPDAVRPELVEIALPVISPETQAKIDAVVNHAIPPVDTEKRPGYPGPRGAEHMRLLTEHAPVVDEPKRGRGRPRPQETIDRDNAVHALLVGADAETGISKESIAAELDEKEQQVYSSLRQLTKEGRAETRYVKPHGYRWFAL